MIKFEKPQFKVTEYVEDRNYGKFEIEPLERGFGTTLGNALRRVMLSSMPGSAITSVKIDGVLHEFSGIPNVVEDVPEIIVNLKNVRLKFEENEEKILSFPKKDVEAVDELSLISGVDYQKYGLELLKFQQYPHFSIYN